MMMSNSLPPSDVFQAMLYVLLIVVGTPIFGYFIYQVYKGEGGKWLAPFRWLENFVYKICGIDPHREMNWKDYTKALLYFNFAGFLLLFILQLVQGFLPLNPQNFSNVSWHLALNTAISFMTNTNWQAYSGEASLSYLTQMLGLAVQNFVSAATAMAVLVALARGISRKMQAGGTIGNFWCDLTRSTFSILLPLSIILTIVLMQQGVVQNFSHYDTATTLAGAEQVIPQGPAASQIAIKQLGTNGGGFFGVNSAHPFENPTPLSNLLQMLAILLLPAAFVYAFGRLIGNRRHAWAIWGAMMFLFLAGLALSYMAQLGHNPAIGNLPFLEGVEQRFGIGNSSIWSVATTAASNGSVNAMHDSFSPIGGMVAMFNMMLGEVIFGGVGCGLYGMILFAILTVFLAGLMVGRTPEYLGKKIGSYEVILASIGILAPCAILLGMAGWASVSGMGLSSLANKGAHGLSEILYAFGSASGNNGSAFAGLSANTPFYNLTLSACMLVARFAPMIPVIAIAGRFSEQKAVPPSPGTFPTDGWLFGGLLVAVVLIVGALTFFPALALGPIVEHFLMLQGRVF